MVGLQIVSSRDAGPPIAPHLLPPASLEEQEQEGPPQKETNGQGVKRPGFLGWPFHLPMGKPLKVSGPQFPHLDNKALGWSLQPPPIPSAQG